MTLLSIQDFWHETIYYLKWFDFFLVPLYILIIYRIFKFHEKKMVIDKPYYKYYTKALMLKITGCLLLFIVFNFYYGYGDTFGYYRTVECLGRLFLKNPFYFLRVWLSPTSQENYALFDSYTLIPPYWDDSQAFFVVRITAPLALLGFNSYLLISLLLTTLTFTGIWKLYLLFIDYFQGASEKIVLACFYIPSVIFWGSGFLKDSITLSCIGWFSYSFYQFAIIRKSPIRYGIILFVASFFIISIKPYIFACLIPTTIFWFISSVHSKITNKVLRILLLPLLMGVSFFSILWLFDTLNQELQEYTLDKVLKQAVIVQADLHQDYYEGTSFDIGSFDPTVSGALSKFPKAIMATFFRPFLWEISSPVVFFAAIESFLLLLFTLKVIFEVGLFKFFYYIFNSPLTVFTFSFSIIFGFSVGLTSANFGSLVRYKIPCMVFYLATIILVRFMHSQKKKLH